MDLSFFKEHPAVTVLVFVVGAFVFYEIALAPGGGSQSVASVPATSGGSNANELAASVQAQQIQAGLTAQTNTLQSNLIAQAANISGQEYIANLSANRDITINTTNVDAQKEVAIKGLTTQQAINDSNNASAISMATLTSETSKALATISSTMQVGLAKITSDTVLGLGAQTADTQKTLGGYQAAVSISSIQGAQAIATAQADASKHNSDNALFGNIFGAIVGAFI